jgi:magnesium-transporting ATPase (P-type)
MSKVSILQQVYILLWKNGILFRRSYIGSILEVLLSLLFIITLMIVRYYVDKTNYPDESNNVENIFESMPLSIRRNRIYYYPNTNYVRDIIINAVSFINSYEPLFTPISIKKCG